MIKRFTALTTLALSTPVFAHEGHGADPHSVFHFFTAPHIALPMGLAVVGLVAYFVLRERSKR